MIYTCSCCKHVEYRDQIACGAYYCTAHNAYMYPGSRQCEDFRLKPQITNEGNQDKKEADNAGK